MNRRRFQTLFAGSFIAGSLAPQTSLASFSSVPDRCRGLLLGGLIGDALGGPMEFAESAPRQLCNARDWPLDRRIKQSTLSELAQALPLISYESIRPESAPYGPWKTNAPAGTLTDDSRHKIVLMMAIEMAVKNKRTLRAEDIAEAYVASKPDGIQDDPQLRALDEEGFREYRFAARWLLGSRDRKVALPPARLWSGIDTCAGQMLLPPLAVAYPGQPVKAYEKAYEVDFVDAPGARDITAALVAGLASALSPKLDDRPVEQRWKSMLEALSQTDPFRLGKVPYVGRPLNKWLSLSDEICQQAQGQPAKLYRLLETKGKPHFWWEAHFTLLVPLTILKFCQYNPLAAMHLTLDFGHDTDSYAQVLGCMIGAVHGTKIFPAKIRQAVEHALAEDYHQEIAHWLQHLQQLPTASQ